MEQENILPSFSLFRNGKLICDYSILFFRPSSHLDSINTKRLYSTPTKETIRETLSKK